MTDSAPTGINDRTAAQWRSLFGDPPNAALLPAFTEPGSAEERVEAFIRHVQKFFAVDTAVADPGDPCTVPELVTRVVTWCFIASM